MLIVDDEPDIREVARMSLETVAGWEVLVADERPSRRRRSLRSERPDAVLLDVMMPDLDGPATLALIREHSRRGPAGDLSDREGAAPSDADRLAELDAQGAIAKPFDPMTLAPQISSALGWPRLTARWAQLSRARRP